MTTATSAEDGFTLVEVLVALALLALMAVYAFSAYDSLGRMQGVLTRQETEAEVDAAARHLRGALADIRPILENSAGVPHLIFSGKSDEITFVTAADGTREPGGLYLAHYFVDDTGALIAERRLLRLPDTAAPSRTLLLRGVKEIAFSYAAKGGGTPSDTWTDERSLPRAIGVTVMFEENDDRRWRQVTEVLRDAE
jgi:type II secretion system protein J